MVDAQPPVKWSGGKRFLLPEILRRLPLNIGTYYEPFVGGGAVFFGLAAQDRFERAVLGDANVQLVRTYEAIAVNVNKVISALKEHAEEHSEAYYYKTRELNPDRMRVFDAAARLIYLNRTCFNGLYRVNRKGGFNVPFGDYKNPTICDEENLRAVAKVLRPVDFIARDFEYTTKGAKAGDVVYMDPPYAPLSPTSNFTGYTKGGFGESDQIRLRDHFMVLDKRGVRVLLSNSDTPLIRKLYKGFRIEQVEAPRRVNSKAEKRGNVKELLISGKSSSR